MRETAFKGQTPRGSLLGVYQAWQVTLLVIGLGGLFCWLAWSSWRWVVPDTGLDLGWFAPAPAGRAGFTPDGER